MPKPTLPEPALPEPAAPDASAMVTPCIKVCAIEPLSGLCIGCGRTMREIGAWASFSGETRVALMAVLPARLERLRATAPDAFMD